MNLKKQEALDLVHSVLQEEVETSIDVRMAVPALYLPLLHELTSERENISIGAQNIHQEASGAFTGEISAEMISSCGIPWTLLGHSERRQLFGETDTLICSKGDRALNNTLGIILCVGEPESIRKEGTHENYVREQLLKSLPSHPSSSDLAKLVIAYEPVWAIGTGLTASPEQAQDMHSFIRSELQKKWGKVGESIPILYGGSMKPANAKELLSQPDIDGGLIGGASLKADSFLQIIRLAENLKD